MTHSDCHAVNINILSAKRHRATSGSLSGDPGGDGNIIFYLQSGIVQPKRHSAPSGSLSGDPEGTGNKTKIEGVNHECYNSCGDDYYKSQPNFKPMKIDKYQSNNINIETITYQYRGYSEKDGGLERYVFEKFIETKDSLFFYNLNDIESINGIHVDELKVKKGGVYLQQNENGEIEKIIVKQISLNNGTKEFIDGRTCFLTPKNQTFANEFSERGIFRAVKRPK